MAMTEPVNPLGGVIVVPDSEAVKDFVEKLKEADIFKVKKILLKL